MATQSQPLTQEKALENWTHFQHLISVGAFTERSSEDYENDTWPEDGIEESVHWLEKWASSEGKEFYWHKDTQLWSLEPIEDTGEDEPMSEEEHERMWCEYHQLFHWPCF